MNTVDGRRSTAIRPRGTLLSRLFAPVDIASLVYFRIAFGAIMLWEVSRSVRHGWIQRYYVDPPFHFNYYGFEWLRPWPGIGMDLHFYALGVLAIFIILGFWYRVSAVRPALRGHARIHRHHYRGERWYVIQDAISGRHHRVDPSGYYLIALMDGQRTVEDIWQAAESQLGDEAPSQPQTIALLAQLHASDLLRSDVAPDAIEVFERFAGHQRSRTLQRWWNPLFARFPLWDPDAFLKSALPIVRPLFR